MSLVVGLLTFILVLNCLFLMLLVLIQLPKKEAGAGLAFGGGASDALFGAGSGTALTKITKYSATTFLGLALALAVLNSHLDARSSLGIEEELTRQSSQAPMVTPPPAAGTQPQQLATEPQPLPAGQQPIQLTTPGTNAPVGTFEPLTTTPPQTTPAPANNEAAAPAESAAAPADAEAAPPANTETPAPNPTPAPEQ